MALVGLSRLWLRRKVGRIKNPLYMGVRVLGLSTPSPKPQTLNPKPQTLPSSHNWSPLTSGAVGVLGAPEAPL